MVKFHRDAIRESIEPSISVYLYSIVGVGKHGGHGIPTQAHRLARSVEASLEKMVGTEHRATVGLPVRPVNIVNPESKDVGFGEGKPAGECCTFLNAARLWTLCQCLPVKRCSQCLACLVLTVPRTAVRHTVAHFFVIRYGGLTTRVLVPTGLQSYIYCYFAA